MTPTPTPATDRPAEIDLGAKPGFTDVFIQKPVLASVISLMILILGLRAIFGLPVRQYPVTENAQVTVTTAYFGASPDVIAGFITTPLEAAIAQAQGIDYISSSSTSGVSVITVNLRLNYDGNRALTEISAKVSSVRNQLPPEAQQPTLAILVGDAIADMYMGFYSNTLESNKVTDYLTRVVQPRLQSVAGVQSADILGSRNFALRAWLDPERLAANNLTASDVYTALAANNYIAAVGQTKGAQVSVNLAADTDLHTVEEFKNLVVRRNGNAFIRLGDVAQVTLGADNYDLSVAFDGKSSVFIGIKAAPDANLLTVVGAVRKVFPDIQAGLPTGLTSDIVYDSTKFVNSSINEVAKTLIEALLIVTVVIFLFMGDFRAVMIPLVAMPLSLIGAFFIMLVLGYSINLLTLLSLVLAIGLVVDDAIIVVENVVRHIHEGHTPIEAALIGTRELARPIISISIVLIAVYVPIGFQGGLTGALFTEFAFTLAGAVAISGIVALTLSPMLSSRLLKPQQSRFADKVDANFVRFTGWYQKRLASALDSMPVVVTFGFLLLLLLVPMSMFSQKELAPLEDQGLVLSLVTGSPNAGIDQMNVYAKQIYEAGKSVPEVDHIFQLFGVPTPNQGITGFLLKPWDARSKKAGELQQTLQKKVSSIAGANVFAFQRPPLPGSGAGLPVQFVISSTDPFSRMDEVAKEIMAEAQATGKFYVLDNSLKIDKPQTRIDIDRDKVAALGLTMKDVGSALTAMLGGGYVNYFSIAGRAYRVIPQVQRESRLNPGQLKDYYVRAPDGSVIPASTFATLKTEVIPESIAHFQQLNSATISGVYGGPQSQALQTLNDIAKKVAPQGYRIDYAGESRQYVAESGGFGLTLFFAILIIYLVLAAQFESFTDPLVVIMSVPMAIFGAMVFIFLGFATLNIYTQVGLVTLVGLIAKHGILIVEFANELRDHEGITKRQAIERATSVRLRPILMTTAAMVFGVTPLVIASGAGAVGRNNMGLVISAGLSIGTLFTLFVVPAMYLLLSRNERPEEMKARARAKAEGREPGAPVATHGPRHDGGGHVDLSKPVMAS